MVTMITRYTGGLNQIGQPSGPIELDLEAGNLVSIFFHMDELLPHPKWRAFLNNIYQ